MADVSYLWAKLCLMESGVYLERFQKDPHETTSQ